MSAAYSDCLLLTCRDMDEIHADDRLLFEELKKLGIRPAIRPWEDVETTSNDFGSIVFRTTWNYTEHFKAFRKFVEDCSRLKIPVWNSPRLIKYNLNKKYMLNLEKAGCPIVPTLFFERGQKFSLQRAAKELESNALVVKPAISAGARNTHLIRGKSLPGGLEFDMSEDVIQSLGVDHDLLVQSYQKEIQTTGELSLIFIDEKLTHTVLKKPAPGDYRVQINFGGSFSKVPTPSHALKAAEKILNQLEESPLYARVDLVESRGRYLLMELELIEPRLFLPLHPESARLLAYSISKSL